MVNTSTDGRLGTMQFADVYGSDFGPRTAQLAGPTAAAIEQGAPPSRGGVEALAAFLLTTPAGVTLIVAGVLIVLSLSD